MNAGLTPYPELDIVFKEYGNLHPPRVLTLHPAAGRIDFVQ
jgi:hypothetical protein